MPRFGHPDRAYFIAAAGYYLWGTLHTLFSSGAKPRLLPVLHHMCGPGTRAPRCCLETNDAPLAAPDVAGSAPRNSP